MPADRLLIFARRPEPGRVKTRLTPPLTPAQAAGLYDACLRDVIALAARERARVELWHDDATGAEEYFGAAFPHLHVEAQPAGGLGERMGGAFERAFGDGAERVVIVGSDAPTLPDSVISAAFDHLHESEAVIGPAVDGGYYLIGLAAPAWPRAQRLFEQVPWSTGTVYEVSLQRAAEATLVLRVLPGWYDIDVAADVARAGADAAPDSHLGRWLADCDAADTLHS